MAAEDLKKITLNYIILNYQQVILTTTFYELPTNLLKEINMIVASYGVRVNLNNRGDNNNI